MDDARESDDQYALEFFATEKAQCAESSCQPIQHITRAVGSHSNGSFELLH